MIVTTRYVSLLTFECTPSPQKKKRKEKDSNSIWYAACSVLRVWSVSVNNTYCHFPILDTAQENDKSHKSSRQAAGKLQLSANGSLHCIEPTELPPIRLTVSGRRTASSSWQTLGSTRPNTFSATKRETKERRAADARGQVQCFPMLAGPECKTTAFTDQWMNVLRAINLQKRGRRWFTASVQDMTTLPRRSAIVV